MKVRRVRHNNRKKLFEIRLGSSTATFPYSKADPSPSPQDAVVREFVDPEIAREGFTYVLASGRTGTVHSEQILE
jgi:hypothetical protein